LDGMQGIARFAAQGYLVAEGVLSGRECDLLALELETAKKSSAGGRRFLERPWCIELANALRQHMVLSHLLPPEAVAVQCSLFSKSSTTNWSVAPHQDLSIPVASRVVSPQCSGWSMKEGMLFVQPPVEVLGSLVAVRLHVDASEPDSGPLRVAPGSHRFGRLSASRVSQSFQDIDICAAPRGAALAMRPLLVHASAKAVATVNRRVLHFLFGPPTLPLGLRWAHAV